MTMKIEKFKPHWLDISDGTVTIAAGNTESIEYTFSDDLRIKKIFIWATDGSDLYNVTMTLRIEDEFITHDSVPAQLFNQSPFHAIELDWLVKNGNKLYLNITNNTAASITLRVFLEVEK